MTCQYFLERALMGLREARGTREETGTSCEETSIDVFQIIIGQQYKQSVISYAPYPPLIKPSNPPLFFLHFLIPSFPQINNPSFITQPSLYINHMQKLCQLYSQGLTIAHRIGGRNIIFFGLLSTAVAVDLLVNDGEKPYYGFHLFKRVKPTQSIYEHPY